jgi:hypothetical protein
VVEEAGRREVLGSGDRALGRGRVDHLRSVASAGRRRPWRPLQSVRPSVRSSARASP